MSRDGGRPLAGVRVVDLTWAWAGPFASEQLAHLGAEVIKVESRAKLDLTRTGPKLQPGASPNVRWNFNNFNQGKRSLTLNLATERAGELVRELVSISDVFVENMTPGVMGRFGLDYRSLVAVRPDLIMLSLSGFGAEGPMAQRPAFGVPLLFMSGLGSLTGYEGDVPRSVGISYPDPVAGFHGAFAVLAALRHRDRTGEGQHIDLSELESMLAYLPEGLLPVSLGLPQPARMGNHHPTRAPQGCYPCRGDDRWVAISILSDGDWQALLQVTQIEALRDLRFATAEGRKAHERELDEVISGWTSTRDRWEVTRALQAAGVPAFPTQSMDDVAADPHLQERGFFDVVEHPEVPGKVLPGVAWHMTRTADRVQSHAPQLGEANRYILQELLGVGDAEFDELVEQQVIY